MDYKEKYEMALEGIQEILGSGEDSIKMSRLQLRLQGIFPELKESENEKMRKHIIEVLKDNFSGEDTDRCIAWLEKQGKKELVTCPICGSKIEKQGEQKSTEWSKEAENNILFLTSIIEECFKDKEKITLCGDTVCANFTKENVIDRLKSLRPQPTWKPTEQQMKVLNEVINFAADHGTMRWNDYIYNVLKGLREQLKKL